MESLFPIILALFSPFLIIIICSKNTIREPLKSKELATKRDSNIKPMQSASTKTTSESYLQPSTSEHKDESIKIKQLFDGECTVAGGKKRSKDKTREKGSVTGEEDYEKDKDHSRKDKRKKGEDKSKNEKRMARKKNGNGDRSERSVDERTNISEKTIRSIRETENERSPIAT